MTPAQFIIKWSARGFGERQAAQTWFLDLLRLVRHPDPIEYDDRDNFTFEKPVPGGFADAYLAGHFGWEFKGRDTQLPGAFDQLLRYQVYLQTPPLLIVSSFELIRVQTNFPGKETVVHEIPIAELDDPTQLDKLRDIFFNPAAFEPQRTVEDVTRETALLFRDIVTDMERRNQSAEQLARYLNQIVFCLYAEDAGLLPEDIFTRITENHFRNPGYFNRAVQELFATMSEGGLFGYDEIAYFNGDLFDESDTVELSGVALFHLVQAVRKNWRDIEPSIFGTLFEGALDATKRSQLGAHYTGADDIMLVVEPVLMKALRREWDQTRRRADDLIAAQNPAAARDALDSFRDRLANVTVLDPACGSGNFLYIALRSLLDLEKQAIDYAESHGFHGGAPSVNPRQMNGIEIDPYAAQLARTALWIGYIQWHQSNGFPYNQQPILTPLDTIRQTDAILDLSDPDNPVEPDWPAAEFIIGNPPFLGHNPFRDQLGDLYADSLYALYRDRIPNSSDLCCYWFEKARAHIQNGKTKRAGLLATQAIRFQSNRPVLTRIKDTGDIFTAFSDQAWVLDGANVHISIICFDDGNETDRTLDGSPASSINEDLTTGIDLSLAKPLSENRNIAFQGISPGGAFDIPETLALDMLSQSNPHGKPNRDVIKRWINGMDIMRRPRDMWIIDFGTDMSQEDAALYEAPFEYVKEKVKPVRTQRKRSWLPDEWWFLGHLRKDMRQALRPLRRYIGTSITAKYRCFAWLSAESLPSSSVVAIASDDDYMFGILHSRFHTTWAAAMGSQLRESKSALRYIVSACFETFPFPHPTPEQRETIATAARELNQLRENWRDADPSRTLTNLYNANPTWLSNAHAHLDQSVARAYNWPPNLPDHQILQNLLTLNLERHDRE